MCGCVVYVSGDLMNLGLGGLVEEWGGKVEGEGEAGGKVGTWDI